MYAVCDVHIAMQFQSDQCKDQTRANYDAEGVTEFKNKTRKKYQNDQHICIENAVEKTVFFLVILYSLLTDASLRVGDIPGLLFFINRPIWPSIQFTPLTECITAQFWIVIKYLK